MCTTTRTSSRGLDARRDRLGLEHHAHGSLGSPLTWTLLSAGLPTLRLTALGIPFDQRPAARRQGDRAVPGSAADDGRSSGPAAFAAAIFAVHPLQAESVAWVAERKDVLSGLFFMLTLGAYLGYVRHPSSPIRYLAVVALFALGLMSKPMVVTLPFVLLLLDYWPLGRIDAHLPASKGQPHFRWRENWDSPRCGRSERLLVEKIPLLPSDGRFVRDNALDPGRSRHGAGVISRRSRIINALVSYVGLRGPLSLPGEPGGRVSAFGAGLPLWKGAAAFLALAGVSAGCAGLPAAARPICWSVGSGILGMLVPMIGLVQVGWHAMADRYTYLPQIGLCLAVTWAAVQVSRPWPGRRWICGVASTLALAVLMAVAWRQAAFWRNSETLWRHALACTTNNALAHRNLGCVLLEQGNRADEAIEQFERALAVDPDNAPVHASLSGRVGHARPHRRSHRSCREGPGHPTRMRRCP